MSISNRFPLLNLIRSTSTTLILMTVAACDLSAQVLYGSLTGTVADPSKGTVAGAVITITNTGTSQSARTTTDAAGYFSLRNLPQGQYDVSIGAPGFKPLTEKGVSVRINNVTSLEFTLEVGAVTDSVTVEASAALLQTSKTDVNVNLDERAIKNLPLAGYRNYQSLLNLVPGATPARFQNAVIDTPGRSLTTNVNGAERGANNTRVDGSANVLVTLPHHTVYVPPVESIEEVNISTNSFDAEQGMTGGAAVTVTTKSGTNQFHGSAFGMHANAVTRAMIWDENRNGVTKKPKGIRNIDGGSIGGPIKKGKLFFFGDWERTTERVGRSGLYSVPTADFRSGDFSRKLGAPVLNAAGGAIAVPTTEGGFTNLRQGMIFDPFSGNADGTGRSVFSSGGRINVLPAARLNASTGKLLALVPQPTQSGDLNNFFNIGTQRFNRNNADVKVNWNRTQKHQLWGKYSTMNALVHGDFGLGAAGGACLCDGGLGDGHTLVQIAGFGQTYTVTPTLLFDGTVGWTRFGQNVTPPDLGVAYGRDVFGIPGTNGPDPRENGLPAFNFTDYSGLGNAEGWNPAFRNDQSITFNANGSWLKGAHEIRFGFDYVHHLMNHWQPELGAGPRGAFDFGAGVTALNPAALLAAGGFQGGTPSFENGWNSMAAFLLGTPSGSSKSSQYIKMDSMENQYALHFRDRWRATKKLTLNLGVRWELYPNRIRSAGLGIESYDPTTNEVLIGGKGGIPRDNGVGYSKKLFAPRIGIAYQLDRDTVIRAGYGLTFVPHPWGAQALRGWYPLTLVSVFNGVNGYSPVTTDPTYVRLGVPNRPLGGDVGIPPICCPDIEKGRVPLPSVSEMGYPVANQELKRGYIQSWNFIVERRFPGQFVTSVGYVATATVNGFAFLDINASQIPGSGNAGRLLFPKFGRTATTREWNGRTHSNYHSLQLTLNRQVRGGLFLKSAYTFSHAIDEANYSDWTAYTWNAAIVFDRNRATATHDVPHNFQFGWLYEMPFGKGKKFLQTGMASAVLGGWQANGIFAAYMGRPYTLSASATSLNMPGNAQTPDQVNLNVAKIGLAGDDGTWFDTSAFARPTGARFGTVGRNTMRGPGVINSDLSIFRTFKLTEKMNLQARAEGFNISNTPHFANPNGNANSGTFGRITATQTADAFGRSREFRFALRLGF